MVTKMTGYSFFKVSDDMFFLILPEVENGISYFLFDYKHFVR